MPSPAIELRAVSKRYGSRQIIHDVSFEVNDGEIVGFLGPNGAGKTTTMRMIAGYTTPSSGSITVAGFDMMRHNLDAARCIGYLPEFPPLYDVMRVRSYLRFVAKAKDIERARTDAALDRVIEACALQAVTDREIYKLSKGYRQRVGLAQALLGSPRVLLLDEPTAGLDPGQIHETREVIRSYGRSCAVLLSTHILPEVTMICQRVAIINHGRLLAIDSPANLQRASEESNSVEVHVDAPVDALRAELLAIDGVQSVHVSSLGAAEGGVRADCHVVVGAGVEARIARSVAARWDMHRLERRAPTLENIFLRYVKQNEQERLQ